MTQDPRITEAIALCDRYGPDQHPMVYALSCKLRKILTTPVAERRIVPLPPPAVTDDCTEAGCGDGGFRSEA